MNNQNDNSINKLAEEMMQNEKQSLSDAQYLLELYSEEIPPSLQISARNELHDKMLHKRLYVIFSEPTEKAGDRKKRI